MDMLKSKPPWFCPKADLPGPAAKTYRCHHSHANCFLCHETGSIGTANRTHCTGLVATSRVFRHLKETSLVLHMRVIMHT